MWPIWWNWVKPRRRTFSSALALGKVPRLPTALVEVLTASSFAAVAPQPGIAPVNAKNLIGLLIANFVGNSAPIVTGACVCLVDGFSNCWIDRRLASRYRSASCQGRTVNATMRCVHLLLHILSRNSVRCTTVLSIQFTFSIEMRPPAIIGLCILYLHVGRRCWMCLQCIAGFPDRRHIRCLS